MRRRKEIGIRKVLGASAGNIVGLISRDFMVLVGIALLLAVPVGWYVMNQWLADFAYATSIGILVFMIAGVFSLAIAFATISLQTLGTIRMNPVESIRDE